MLLTLPAELRNSIYAFALILDHAVYATDGDGHEQESPALLRTCKQIRTEAMGLFYSVNNMFIISIQKGEPEPATRWLAHHRSYHKYDRPICAG